MGISERETQGLGGRITFTLNYFGTVSIFFYLHVLLIKKIMLKYVLINLVQASASLRSLL